MLSISEISAATAIQILLAALTAFKNKPAMSHLRHCQQFHRDCFFGRNKELAEENPIWIHEVLLEFRRTDFLRTKCAANKIKIKREELVRIFHSKLCTLHGVGTRIKLLAVGKDECHWKDKDILKSGNTKKFQLNKNCMRNPLFKYCFALVSSWWRRLTWRMTVVSRVTLWPLQVNMGSRSSQPRSYE